MSQKVLLLTYLKVIQHIFFGAKYLHVDAKLMAPALIYK